MSAIGGSVKSGFEPVAEAFAANFDPRSDLPDIGASFAVIRGDETIVDLFGGHAHPDRMGPWTKKTVTNVYSTSKGVTACCTALLESRGQLDYAAPVARYWPEFAQAGKGAVTVEMLLSHQAGLSGLRESVAVDDLFDWSLMADRLARAEPLWAPGTMAGYHAITWGYLAGELVRRIDGRSIGRFLREELCEPLGADVFIGLPAEEDHRYATLAKPPAAQTQSLAEMTEILRLTLGNPTIEGEVPNRRAWRAAEIPAAGACANALGLARLYAPLANGGAFAGQSFYSPDAIARAMKVRFSGIDMNLGVPVRWGAGFFGNNPQRWYGPDDDAFGHSGWGGSCAFFDPARKLAVGWAMNQMDANLHGDPRSIRLIDVLYKCLSEGA
jgi:CubicO group peptidase (beta-lactamase class C family)